MLRELPSLISQWKTAALGAVAALKAIDRLAFVRSCRMRIYSAPACSSNLANFRVRA